MAAHQAALKASAQLGTKAVKCTNNAASATICCTFIIVYMAMACPKAELNPVVKFASARTLIFSALLLRQGNGCPIRRTAAADCFQDGQSERSIAGGPKKLASLQNLKRHIVVFQKAVHGYLDCNKLEGQMRVVCFFGAMFSPAASEVNHVHIPDVMRTGCSESQHIFSCICIE